ncbi:LPXTG cell wall anchor domain-containing protein [Protaetiibacter larvae]|nr:LPXTG cell wall anchor domain-containing protein [Protaetiibacter larvae]
MTTSGVHARARRAAAGIGAVALGLSGALLAGAPAWAADAPAGTFTVPNAAVVEDDEPGYWSATLTPSSEFSVAEGDVIEIQAEDANFFAEGPAAAEWGGTFADREWGAYLLFLGPTTGFARFTATVTEGDDASTILVTLPADAAQPSDAPIAQLTLSAKGADSSSGISLGAPLTWSGAGASTGDDESTTPDTSAPSVGAAPGSTLSPGGSLVVDAGGFTPGESVEVWLHSDPVKLGTLVAGGTGRISGSFTIPGSVPVGNHTVVATGLTSGASVSIAIRLQLPNTGVDVTPLLLVAGVLGLGGLALVVTARRRGVVTPA